MKLGKQIRFGYNTLRTVVEYNEVDYTNANIKARVKLQGSRGRIYEYYLMKSGRLKLIY